MRWIFFTLVVLNVAYLIWSIAHLDADTANRTRVEWPALRGEELVLLKERLTDAGTRSQPSAVKSTAKPILKPTAKPVVQAAALAKPEPKPEPKPKPKPLVQVAPSVAAVPAPAVEPASTLPVPKPLVSAAGVSDTAKDVMCTSIGPFASQKAGDVLVRNLEMEGYKAAVQSLELSRDIQFWVLLPPYPNKPEALQVLKQLQTKNIDSYLMATGAMKNAISLGLFNKESSAKGVLDRIQAAGFEAEIRQQESVEREFWVRVPPGQPVEKLQETLETLVSAEADAKISSASCEMFALTQ